jgi:hypothetical protein
VRHYSAYDRCTWAFEVALCSPGLLTLDLFDLSF